MIQDLHIVIGLPIIAGLLLFAIPDRWQIIKGVITTFISIVGLVFAIRVYGYSESLMPFFTQTSGDAFQHEFMGTLEYFTRINVNALNQLILLFISVIAPLIALFAVYKETPSSLPSNFHSWFLFTLGSATATVMFDNLLIFLFFWGILGLTLFKLIAAKDEISSEAAKKTMVIIGASDALMIIGIGLLWSAGGSLNISSLSRAPLYTGDATTVIAFLALAIGAFTKAGAFPFHTWIIDYTTSAHAISSAFMPASLDKLIGIYFLTLLCARIFELNQWLVLVLLIIAVCTIIFAVMMALVQHNFKKLLGYHAVSQVGYMVLGIAIGSPLGIAAGLFHMINHAVYKGGLFLTAVSVERRTGNNDLDKSGGLAAVMPFTFFAALIFSLSISGIPPLNGFASKWMIYQSVVEFGQQPGVANQLWMIWLALAVFGSALTLASFIKYISGVFLGRRSKNHDRVQEVPILQWIPMILLAVVCIWFGSFSTRYVTTKLFMPIAGEFSFIAIWDSTLLLWMVVATIIVGFLVYLIGNIGNMRRVEPFIGGEKAGIQQGFPVTGFYQTFMRSRFLSLIYAKAEQKWFDLYDLMKGCILWLHQLFSRIHSGVLTRYTIWLYGGLVIILLILILQH
jgi:multicomponent Na+:H+ antiporter subunit A